jgi:hypothetical protein
VRANTPVGVPDAEAPNRIATLASRVMGTLTTRGSFRSSAWSREELPDLTFHRLRLCHASLMLPRELTSPCLESARPQEHHDHR